MGKIPLLQRNFPLHASGRILASALQHTKRKPPGLRRVIIHS
jgi:hypothetical protein